MKTTLLQETIMRRSHSFLLLAMLAALSLNAVADPYVGASVGSVKYTIDFSSLGGSTVDETGTGTKLYAGYSFNKYYAAEAAYYNFAEASVGAAETAPGSGTFVSGSASVDGFGAYAVGMYPVSKEFNLMAKLGLLSWNADLNFNDITGTDVSASNSGTDVAYALAASYAFTKELLVVAEWESFNTDNPELSMFSLGFRVNFR